MEANDQRWPRVVGRDGQPVGLAQPLPISRRRPTATLLQRGRCGPRLPRGSRAADLPPRVVLPASRGSSGGHAAEQAVGASPFPAVFQPGQHESVGHSGLPDRRCPVGNISGSRSFTLGLGLTAPGHEKESPAALHAPEAHPVDSHTSALTITELETQKYKSFQVAEIFLYLEPLTLLMDILLQKPKNSKRPHSTPRFFNRTKYL